MDRKVANLKTPKECEIFARNAAARDRPDLAKEATRRSVELRAEMYGLVTDAEKEALKAVYAYEEVLSAKHGRRTRASRTWQMIERHGVIGVVERAVNRPATLAGYQTLMEMGLEDLAFEAVVVKHPRDFSAEAVDRAKERIALWKSDA